MNRTAPFPFTLMFQNGPRRQGFASPRKPSAPLTAPGRSENFPMRRERGQTQRVFFAARYRLPLVGLELRAIVWSRQTS